jgi:two-component system chemotaxis response regulator CheY
MSKTIMVVDDSTSIRQVSKMVLTSKGYDVVTAEDGQDALQQLDGRKIHLIISDLNMPRLDGLSLLRKVKELPAYKFTPFVMLTTESGESFMTQGKNAGAKAWMVKPFQPEALMNVVQKLLG